MALYSHNKDEHPGRDQHLGGVKGTVQASRRRSVINEMAAGTGSPIMGGCPSVLAVTIGYCGLPRRGVPCTSVGGVFGAPVTDARKGPRDDGPQDHGLARRWLRQPGAKLRAESRTQVGGA